MKPSRIRTIDRWRNATIRLVSVAAWIAPVTRAVCRFFGVRAGSYAVAAFEDRNGNGVLDTNAFGVPTKGVAFSRNARGRLGPPTFDAARFVHGPDATRLQLRAVY